MPFLCCRSPQTVFDPASYYPRHQELHGSVVIATVEQVPTSNRCSSSSTKHPTEALGIKLKREYVDHRQHVIIQKIQSNSCLKRTPLQEGMILFRVNDVNIENKTLSQIDHVLRKTKLPLQLWARTLSSSRHPTTPNTTMNHGRNRGRRFSIDTVSSFDAKLILAVAHKGQRSDDTLGLTLRQCPNTGTFIVDAIHPTSPFHPHDASLLREGMIISSINGLSITGMDREVALSAIRDAPGSVILAAQVPPGTMEEPPMIRKRVVASIHKPSADATLGLSLLRIPIPQGGGDGSIKSTGSKRNKYLTVVGRIGPSCPFSATELAVGMEITTINGMDVSKSDAKDMLKYLNEHCGKVVILAETDVPAEDSLMTVVTTPVGDSGTYSTRSSSSAHEGQHHHQHYDSSSMPPPVRPQEGNARAVGPQGRPADDHGTRPLPMTQEHCFRRYDSPPMREGHPDIWHETEYDFGDRNSGTSSARGSVIEVRKAVGIKPCADHFLGVALEDDSLGSFFVSQISPNSPFRITDLVVGAEIVSINGVQLAGLDMTFVTNLLRNIVGPVVMDFLIPASSHHDAGSAARY